MQSKNKLNYTLNYETGKSKELKRIYRQFATIHKVYLAQFVEIHTGAHQGRLWTLQAFQKALDGAGLKSKLIGENEGRPRKPRLGDYLLLVEDRFLLDIAYDKHWSLTIGKSGYNRVPPELGFRFQLRFNFGRDEPEYMCPYDYDGDVDDCLELLLDQKA